MRLRHHTLLNMVCNRLGRSPGVNSWPLVACATVSVWGCVGVVACAFLTCPYLRGTGGGRRLRTHIVSPDRPGGIYGPGPSSQVSTSFPPLFSPSWL